MTAAEVRVDMEVFAMGLQFALCQRDFGDTRSAVRELQNDFAGLVVKVESLIGEVQ